MSGDELGADAGNGLQQKLREIAEGDGLLLGDAALGHQKKDLSEGTVNVGGAGEIGAECCERFDGVDRGAFGAKTSLAFGGVVKAERGALAAASASIGESEGAAVRAAVGVLGVVLVARFGATGGEKEVAEFLADFHMRCYHKSTY